MATKRAVAVALALLNEAFSGNVTDARVDVYTAALDDLSDDDIARATALVIRSHTGEFIPPPAVIRAALGAAKPLAPAVDAEHALDVIAKDGVYRPGAWMIYPSVDAVRAQHGDAIAYAYAAGGGAPRVFSDNETTRSIARREFQLAYGAAITSRDPIRIANGEGDAALLDREVARRRRLLGRSDGT
jgi:hypothetical protein